MKVIIYHHCDTWKNWSSFGEPKVFATNISGRKALLAQIKKDILEEDIEVDGDFEEFENLILTGEYGIANNHIIHGVLLVTPVIGK